MPVVVVKLLEGRTQEQKNELAKAITDAVATICRTAPEATQVVFEDTKRSDWYVAGKPH